MSGLRAEPVDLVLPVLPPAGRGRRRQLERRERRAEVEARAADDERQLGLVDRRVREPLVGADGDILVQRDDADELGRIRGRGRDHRQARVERSRVGRDDGGAELLAQEAGDGGLARRGRPEEREDATRLRRPAA